MADTYTLYSMQESGNCYKPRLIMRQLGLEFRLIDTDSRRGKTRTPEFLAINPNGKVPVLILPDGRVLAESNAMLLHLAEGTPLLPADAYDRALCFQWLFFEQYSHEPYIANAWSLVHLKPEAEPEAERLTHLYRGGHAALAVMDRRLADHDWLAGADYSAADIGLYAYTHVADQGGFDLSPYPAIGDWLDRVASQPRHINIDWRP